MKKGSATVAIISVVVVLLCIIIALLMYLVYQLKVKNPQTAAETKKTEETVKTEDTSTPLPILTSEVIDTVTPEPTIHSVSDKDLVQEAMAKRHNRTVADTQISISKNNGTHIWGSVKFGDEMGGGWFLAYKKDGTWIIVDDGNGTIECSTIAPYNFPVDMVSECWDSQQQKSIKR